VDFNWISICRLWEKSKKLIFCCSNFSDNFRNCTVYNTACHCPFEPSTLLPRHIIRVCVVRLRPDDVAGMSLHGWGAGLQIQWGSTAQLFDSIFSACFFGLLRVKSHSQTAVQVQPKKPKKSKACTYYLSLYCVTPTADSQNSAVGVH
jgi:hypothetical protein